MCRAPQRFSDGRQSINLKNIGKGTYAWIKNKDKNKNDLCMTLSIRYKHRKIILQYLQHICM